MSSIGGGTSDDTAGAAGASLAGTSSPAANVAKRKPAPAAPQEKVEPPSGKKPKAFHPAIWRELKESSATQKRAELLDEFKAKKADCHRMQAIIAAANRDALERPGPSQPGRLAHRELATLTGFCEQVPLMQTVMKEYTEWSEADFQIAKERRLAMRQAFLDVPTDAPPAAPLLKGYLELESFGDMTTTAWILLKCKVANLL